MGPISDITGARALESARRALGLSLRTVWIRYFGLGGNASADELEQWLSGRSHLSVEDHDLVAHALNEEFDARGENHPLPYRRSA
jgi:hypothetical protein